MHPLDDFHGVCVVCLCMYAGVRERVSVRECVYVSLCVCVWAYVLTHPQSAQINLTHLLLSAWLFLASSCFSGKGNV
jgi:hypothetical protein